MSTCGSGSQAQDYNLPLHVGALFIILAVSAGACALPIIALKVPKLHIPTKAHFVFRHFGTRVLIATAFVHLLPTAFVSLTNPCLPPFFTDTFPAFAGAIALAAVFIITIAEMIFSPERALCSGSVADSAAYVETSQSSPLDEDAPTQDTRQFGHARPGRSFSYMQNADDSNDASPMHRDRFYLQEERRQGHESMNNDSLSITKRDLEQERKRLAMQCVLLECGILFHSVFIGMSLAVSVGREQVILIIAIAFHQTFEGLALGSRIATVGWKNASLKPWAMALAYGCTTPLGQAIGIATRNLYDPDSATGLMVVGTMNAISAGLLTFASLVDLLAEDFLTERSWKTMKGNKRIVGMSLVTFGAFCMSLIGAWA